MKTCLARAVGLLPLTCLILMGGSWHLAIGAEVHFDSIPEGPIGDQYLSRGVKFFVGNGAQGASTGVLVENDVEVSAEAFEHLGAVSQPNLMVPRPGSNADIIVQFFGPHGQRETVAGVGIVNDLEGRPSRIFIEGFDDEGLPLGRTQIDGAGEQGTFSAPGIFYAKIYSAPGFPGLLGVDDFQTQDEAGIPTLRAWGLAILGLLIAISALVAIRRR